ncbi:hypothetical protein [Streptomyces chartreusis]|uniref:hypothetical protein n=1 Tax=Streptomyces chartreusis TaxID=1969 RepID=UPI0034274DB2
MARTYQALAAALGAVVVLGAAGCSSGDSGSDKPAKSKNGSDRTKGSGESAEGGKGSAKEQAPNGVEKLSAQQIFDKALAATAATPTLRVVVPGAVDLTMDQQGNCAGTVAITPGAPFEVLRKKDQVWAKPKDEAAYYASEEGKSFLKAVPDAKGKYMYGSKDKSFTLGILSLYCGLDDMGVNPKTVKPTTKAGRATVTGQNAVVLKATSDKAAMTMYVATEEEPYILKVLEVKAGKKQEVLLSDFGKPFSPPAAPPPGQTYDAVKAENAAMMGSAEIVDQGAS